jgi:hypothetical protein
MRAGPISIKLAIIAVLAILITSGAAQVVSAGDGSGIQWKVSDTFYGRPAVALDGTLYVFIAKVNSDGTKDPTALRALDTNGNIIWELPVHGSCSDPIVDGNGSVYYVTYSRNSYNSDLVAIDKYGSTLWSFNSSAEFPEISYYGLGIPKMSSDGNILITYDSRLDINYGTSLLCSIGSDGVLQWTYPIQHQQGGICQGRDPGSPIYVTSYGGMVQCLLPNGTLSWTLDMRGDDVLIEPTTAVGLDDFLYVTIAKEERDGGWINDSVPRQLWAIAPNGMVAWKAEPLSGLNNITGCQQVISGIADDGSVLISIASGSGMSASGTEIDMSASLMALDSIGQMIWERSIQTGLRINYPVILTASAAYVFTVNAKEEGGMLALNLGNGSEVGNYTSPTDLWVSGAAAGSGDRLYYFEGAYKGAEEGVISLICSFGLPHTLLPRPLDLTAASMAWFGILGLAAISGVVGTRVKRH